MKTINIFITTIFVIVLCATSAYTFESEMWPGEGRPSFRALKDLRLHQSPNSSSPLLERCKIPKGEKISFSKTIYRTVRTGRIKVAAPVKISGQSYGPIKYLSNEDYYSPSVPEKIFTFKPGDTFECMQCLAEGEYLVRIKGEIVGLELTEEMELESVPEKEWWINVVNVSGTSIGWLLIKEESVEFLTRELG